MDNAAVEFVLRAKDESSQVINKIASELTGMQGGLAGLAESAGPLGGLAAAFTGVAAAVTAAGVAFAENAEQLEHSARRTGLGVEQYQLIKQAIEDSGGSANGLNLAIQRLNNNIAKGNPMVKDLHLNIADTGTAFMDLIRHVAEAKDHFTATNEAMELMGRGAGEIIGSAKALAEEFDKTADRAEKYGTIIREGAAARTQELRDRVHDLTAAWKGLSIAFQEFSVGPATLVLNALKAILDVMNDLGRTMLTTISALGSFFANPAKVIFDAFTRRQAAARGVELDENGLPKQPPPKPHFEDLFPQLHETIAALQESAKNSPMFEGGTLRGVKSKGPDEAQKAFDKVYMASEKMVKSVGLKLPQAIDAATLRSEMLASSLDHAASMIAGSMLMAINSVITGTESIGQAFGSLITSILADIAQAAAELGIGLGLTVLGAAIGGPVGGFIGKVGGNITGINAEGLQPGGGVTNYYIQTLNAKDLVQSLVSPTGQMRAANSRITELAAVS